MSTYPLPSRGDADGSAHDALTELYVRHYSMLVAIASRILSDGLQDDREDVVQEAYLRVRTRRQTRDIAPGGRRAYLCQTVANVARDAVRRRMVTDRHRSPQVPMPSAEDSALRLLLPNSVVAAMRGLPARQREAVVLRHYVGMPPAEAAAAMGCTPVAVRSYTSRALAALASQTPPRVAAIQAA